MIKIDTLLHDLDLSVRLYNKLKGLGVKSFRDVLTLDIEKEEWRVDRKNYTELKQLIQNFSPKDKEVIIVELLKKQTIIKKINEEIIELINQL
jgi:hypothetical protein